MPKRIKQYNELLKMLARYKSEVGRDIKFKFESKISATN